MDRHFITLAGLSIVIAAGWGCSVHAQDDLGLDDYRYKSGKEISEPSRPATPPAGTPAPGQSDENLVPAIVGLPPRPSNAEYHIGPQDLLTVEVFQVEELSSRERVDAAGNIVMPLIGPVRVGGLSREQAEATIAAELARDYLHDPQVNIFIEEYASQRVTVAGAVNKPGVFPITGPTTLVQALAMAGGVTSVANEEEILLFRKLDDDKVQAYVMNLEKIGRGELRDPEVAGSDRIIVPESGSAVFFKGFTDTLRGFVRIPVY